MIDDSPKNISKENTFIKSTLSKNIFKCNLNSTVEPGLLVVIRVHLIMFLVKVFSLKVFLRKLSIKSLFDSDSKKRF